MKELNWNIFELKFNGKQQAAFERMAYGLFCSRFNKENGIFAYKNQVGIETEPIDVNGRWVGFQAKYLEPSVSFSSRKQKFINSLEKTVGKNPNLHEIYFYVNKPFSESKIKGQKKPKYQIEIEEKAKDLEVKINWQVPSQIEMQLSNSKNIEITREFFPELIEKEVKSSYQRKVQSIKENTKDFNQCKFDYSKQLEIARTAQIQLEIEKLKFEFSNDWKKSIKLLDKLFVYSEYRNETIAWSILDFLHQTVSNHARTNFPTDVALNIHSLIITYYPSSHGEKEVELRKENGEQCIHTGFNLAYDAFIYTNNYRIAQFGLNIWKYIYRESKRSMSTELQELSDLVMDQYKELEETLLRPERDDLEYARELVRIFKEDLESYSLSFPVMSEKLFGVAKKYNLDSWQ
ncbi:MAG: hypothetical protein COA32_10395 [Fluviicola sp.]|nr:MAG: hypothetical protein COA32_10395 [Fluviicola sp.]